MANLRRFAGQPEGAGDTVLQPLWKVLSEHDGLLLADACRQTILARCDQLPDDAFDPLRGLALAKNDLGKAATLSSLKVYVGESQVDLGRIIETRQGRLNAQVARAHLFQQFPQITRLHASPLFVVLFSQTAPGLRHFFSDFRQTRASSQVSPA